jgi:3-methyladenine DNA glycosylase Tag
MCGDASNRVKKGATYLTWKILPEVPAATKESEALRKDLVKRGFKFVGSTIVYAHMQAGGLVNDPLVECWRYELINEAASPWPDQALRN